MGILICGLNGTGKSTLGKDLAEKLGYRFIDNEDLFFPKENDEYEFANPRSKQEVITILENMISRDSRFVFAAVKGNYGDKFIYALESIILIEVPRQERHKRVRERSYRKFGDRMKEGGDLFDKENHRLSIVDGRSEAYVTRWLEGVRCPVIKIDGTLPVSQNVEYLVSVLKSE
ncbi:MAG: AAA family ATPase [Clostridia bacterium]|nr:AAA family ATPase [Clostridia bacterium]